MKDFEEFKKLPFSSQVAVCSFLIGSCLFISLWIFPKEEMLLVIGFLYIILAGIINGISILIQLNKLTSPDIENKQVITEILIILANIPIAILYLYIIINHLNKF